MTGCRAWRVLLPIVLLTAARPGAAQDRSQADLVPDAVRGVGDHRMSYYDAQVWAAAKLNQVPVVLSEDFPSGATVEGVTFLDPLAASFDLAELG